MSLNKTPLILLPDISALETSVHGYGVVDGKLGHKGGGDEDEGSTALNCNLRFL